MRRHVMRTFGGIVAMAGFLALVACTQGAGPAVDQTREVGPFSRIEAGGGVQVRVTIGPAGPIVVHAQENIQAKVTTEVRSDGTLRIEANEDFVVADPVLVAVTTPELAAISLSGGASVELDGLETDALDLSLSGGARATISGTASAVTISARGGSTASLYGLESETVMVNLDGGATAEVQASGSVKGRASGGAKLRTRGAASIQVETSDGAEVDPG
jgi:Putative auto-transporter adhesin, head GIN domain